MSTRFRFRLYGGGPGEVITYSRCIPFALTAGFELSLDVEPSLHRLLSLLGAPFGKLEGSVCSVPLWDFCRCFTGYTQEHGESFPLPTTLWADPAVPSLPPVAGCRVGVCWASGNPERRLPAGELCSQLAMPGVALFSLQLAGYPGAEHSTPPAWSLPAPRYPLDGLAGRVLPDWAVVAAYVQQCDLVVTVNTSMAFLAASLRVPTWVLEAPRHPRADVDPVLGEGRTTSWYLSMRIYPLHANLEDDFRAFVAQRAAA